MEKMAAFTHVLRFMLYDIFLKYMPQNTSSYNQRKKDESIVNENGCFCIAKRNPVLLAPALSLHKCTALSA
jgi:hypothetical protein